MAASCRPLVLALLVSVVAAAAVAERALCPRSDDLAFLDGLRSQCPRWIELSSPLQVSGEVFDIGLILDGRSPYHSVIIYASWCPFSRNTLPTFDALSSMFPQIIHIAVEESSVMPSVLSRYGIHSFPAVLLVNRTTRVRYHGPKDVSSLVQFYKKVTGFEQITYLVVDQPRNSENMMYPRLQTESLRELITKEPYVVFGVLFICLKIVACFFPILCTRLRFFWVSHAWRLNLGVLHGSRQLLLRVLHIVDVKRLRSKIGLCNKTRNFQRGANNARVWASSLASVSLGESSSSRLSHSDL